MIVACWLSLAAQQAQSDDPANGQTSASEAATSNRDPSSGQYRVEVIRGQIVWTAEALKNQFGISTVPEVAESSLAILTPDRELIPLVENIRGRAFRKDPRLRGQPMELRVRRYEGQPLVQVLRIYLLEDGKRYELDYWCDVCAIVMFETGPCSCCQDDNRLRKTLVAKNDAAGSHQEDTGEQQ